MRLPFCSRRFPCIPFIVKLWLHKEGQVGMKDTGDETCIALLGQFFPVRSDFLAGFLIEANKSERTMDVWRERQLFNFIKLLAQNAEDLVQGYRAQRISKVAWAARNILEIAVWVDYCNLSDAHAKIFRDDNARELLGRTKAVKTTEVHNQGTEDVERAVRQGDITTVSEAAKELGRQPEFLALNKMYSKYARPTSIALNSVAAVEADAGFRSMFLRDAVGRAADTLTTIREAIAKNFPQIDRAPVIGKFKPAA
jgi:hypothetical protein